MVRHTWSNTQAIAMTALPENSIRAVNGPDFLTNDSWASNNPFFFLMDLETQADSPHNVPDR